MVTDEELARVGRIGNDPKRAALADVVFLLRLFDRLYGYDERNKDDWAARRRLEAEVDHLRKCLEDEREMAQRLLPPGGAT